MRRAHAKRRDQNEPDIVKALRAAGAYVQLLEQGGGVPDLLVGYRGRTYLVEVKNPEEKRSGGGSRGAKPGEKRTPGRGVLTADQVTWFAAWKGAPVIEVINAREALVAIGAATKTIAQLLAEVDAAVATARKVGRMFAEATKP